MPQAIVVACVIVSSGAYLIFSQAIRAETENAAYRRLLWSSFFSRPHEPLIEPIRFDARGTAALGALILLAIVTGVLTRRAAGSREPDAGPEVIVHSLAAVVVPVLIIAAAGWPDGRGWLTTGNLLIATAALCAGTAVLASRANRPNAPVAVRAPSEAVGAFGTAFAVVSLAFAAVLTVVGLSSLRGFDALAYHLPMAASWLRHSRLTTNVEDAATFFFPGNAELFVRWILTSGTDRLSFVPSLLAAAGCCYVVYKIAIEIGQPREAAMISGLSASSCVLLAFIATTAYMDAFMALTLLLATLFLLRALRSPPHDRAPTVAFGTALGLAIGSKYSALQPAFILGLLWLLHIARRRWRPYEGCFRFLDFRALLRDVMPAAIPVVLCSAYWYVRNAVQHGNPLFPFAVLGLRGLPNEALIYVRPEVATPIDWLLYPWREMYSHSLDDYVGGVFGGVALVGLIAAAARGGENRDRHRVVLITIASFAFWLVTGNFVPRYGIFPILLTFVFVGDLWMQHRSKVLRITTFAILTATLFVFGRSLATQAVYVTIQGRPRYGVPLIVDRLPPARILNATPSMANYYLMGSDYRHDVITTFAKARPEDLVRFSPDYVLLKREDASAFGRRADLDHIASSESGDLTPADLYRVTPRYAPGRR